uniref:SFRICE_012564 n=1 Tax=Spodoptera frugiperda TaxID=7108 RepID=A0A2H1WNZ5_SPOFR
MALYGAPVWALNLMRRPARALLTSQRVMAIRVILGYRTISGEAANLLAGLPLWDLEAKVLAHVFSLRADACHRGETPLPRQISAWRDELRRDLMAEWQQRLSQPRAGLAVIAAVSPLFEEWLERRHGVLTYRLTQVLTGHGSFGRFLFLIGREETPGCHHCEDRPEDTVEHTVAVCPAWAEHRQVLRDVVGDGDLSRPALVQAMVRSERDWDVVSFCEAVMLAKEEAERVREQTSSRPSRRERHSGRRGSREDLRPP